MQASSAPSVPSLDEVLSYRNDAVIGRFTKLFAVEREEAARLFEETKKWLWLCAVAGQDEDAPDLFIDGFIGVIDQMWHNFILFTRDYHSFCMQYLGVFIDHYPVTETENQAEDEAFTRDPDAYRRQQEEKYRRFYSYIYDHLGEATLKRWMVEFSGTYTPEYLKSILIKP